MESKLSYVNPIWKSGDRSITINWPSSKLYIVLKLLEKILEPKLTDLFNHVFVNEQHGFRRAKSTLTNTLVFYSYLVETVTLGGHVDAIYTDLHKAFDKVDHGLLLAKLHKLGFRDPLLSWFSSYLSKRSQLVKIGNSVSNFINITSGVPQGGHLSPYDLFYL